MLSIEEIKLLIEKLEKVKKEDLKELIDSNLAVLKDIEQAVDANNDEVINRLDKTPEWFTKDIDYKRKYPAVDQWLFRMIQTKIFQFARESYYHCLEIGPGTGMFSLEFKSWELNYFVDVNPWVEKAIRKKLPRKSQGSLRFYLTDRTNCDQIPSKSCNFVFSWDTFVFLRQEHIRQYLHDIKRVLIPGGHVFIQYADCHYDIDLLQAQKGYWNYNTKTTMTKIIQEEGYEVVEMNQFKPGANYAIFRKPGKQKAAVDKFSEIKLD